MKSHLKIVLIGMVLAPCIGLSATFTDDQSDQETNPLEEWELLKKPLKLHRQEELADKMHEVLGVFEALGGVAAQLLGAGARIDPEPLEQQLAPQIGQLLKAELRFVRTICQPSPGQYQSIKSAGDAGLQVAVKKCARAQIQMQEGIRFGSSREMPDPRSIIAEALAKSVTQTLSAEQAQRYQLELQKRAAARKRAALLNLVAMLDQNLVLTAEQRTQLTESLQTHWKKTWGQSLEGFMVSGQNLPELPDGRVLPILNETQKEIWNRMPKQEIAEGWMEFGFMLQFANDVEIPEAMENADEKINDETNKEQNGDQR